MFGVWLKPAMLRTPIDDIVMTIHVFGAMVLAYGLVLAWFYVSGKIRKARK